MPKLNEQIKNRIKPSGTIALFNKVKAMRDAGADIIAFTAGELNVNSPDSAKSAAIEAIKQNFTRYTISDGTLELREKVSEYLFKEQGQKYSTDEILITNGCKQASFNILNVILSAGDEVILPAPYYTSHIRQVQLLGANPVLVKTEQSTNYQLTKELLKKAVTPKCKVMFLTSPQNPTGAVYTEDSLNAAAEIAIENDLWIIFDEVYAGIVYPPAAALPILKVEPELTNRLFIVGGLSKSFAMTGWRVGFGAGPKSVMEQASNVQANTTSNVCSISQKAALGALTKDPEYYKTFLADFQKRRDMACDAVSKIEGVKCEKPDGAFYLFPNIKAFFGKRDGTDTIDSGKSLAHYLLDKHKLAVIPGEAFGAPEHIRISFSVSNETLVEGLKRLKKGLESLR